MEMQTEESLIDINVEDDTVINSQPSITQEDEHTNPAVAAPPTSPTRLPDRRYCAIILLSISFLILFSAFKTMTIITVSVTLCSWVK